MAKRININNYIGVKYGKLKILKEDGNDKWGHKKVIVECDCENKTMFSVLLFDVLKEHTKSCGCLKVESQYKTFKKYNTYDLTGEYGIGYSSNTNEPFYFDLEDYDKIKDICWLIADDRVKGTIKNKLVLIHRLLTNINSNQLIDHINLNPRDNRKSNLRLATTSQNGMNRKGNGIMSKFGLKGIYWDNSKNRWRCQLKKNKKHVFRKMFYDLKEAIHAQIEAEKIHFGEYRYVWENDIKWEELLEYEREVKELNLK